MSNLLQLDESTVRLHDERVENNAFNREVLLATVKLLRGKSVKAIAKKVRRGIKFEAVEAIKELRHRNIIRYYGIFQKQFVTFIIAELAEYGILRYYLDDRKGEKLSSQLYLKWMYELADGIRYLQDCDYEHRELSSIDCFIADNFTLKLGDFDSTKEDITFTRAGGSSSIIRWTAPEVIKEEKRSVKSHVFSYGVMIWEIFTTEIPYSDIRGDFHVMVATCSGKRLTIPNDCPHNLKRLMQDCWRTNYEERPNIGDICQRFRRASISDDCQRVHQEMT